MRSTCPARLAPLLQPLPPPRRAAGAGMPASYELKEEEVRQQLFDLESAYNEFMQQLNK